MRIKYFTPVYVAVEAARQCWDSIDKNDIKISILKL